MRMHLRVETTINRLVAALLVICTFTGLLQASEEPIDSSYTKVIKFISVLEKPLLQLGEEVDRQHLVNYLNRFGTSLSDIQHDKGQILILLDRSTLDREDLERLASRLLADDRLASQRLDAISFVLKEKFQSKGLKASKLATEAVDDLTEVFQFRNSFITKFLDEVRHAPDSQLRGYIPKVNDSVGALSKAINKLAKVTAELDKQR